MTETPGTAARPTGSQWAVAAALAVALTAAALVTHYLGLEAYPEVVANQAAWHQAILENRGPYPDQYRILTYYLAEGLLRAGLPFVAAHLSLRFLFTLACLILFYGFQRKWLTHGAALLGCLALGLALPFSYRYYFMQPTDPLNLVVFVIGLWCIREGWHGRLAAVILVGMLNRETPLVLPAVYAAAQVGLKPARQWLPQAALLMGLGAAVYLGLRISLGLNHPAYVTVDPWVYLRDNLTGGTAYLQLASTFHLLPILAAHQFRAKPRFLRRAALLMTPVFLLVHAAVGYLKETRLLLPLLLVVIPLALLSLKGQGSEA